MPQPRSHCVALPGRAADGRNLPQEPAASGTHGGRCWPGACETVLCLHAPARPCPLLLYTSSTSTSLKTRGRSSTVLSSTPSPLPAEPPRPAPYPPAPPRRRPGRPLPSPAAFDARCVVTRKRNPPPPSPSRSALVCSALRPGLWLTHTTAPAPHTETLQDWLHYAQGQEEQKVEVHVF